MHNATIQYSFRTTLKSGLATMILLTAVVLTGCKGGAETIANPDLGGSTPTGVGGIPQTDLVQRFKQEMWPNLSARCGACHEQGGQSPTFSRWDDINLAYNEAITVTNLGAPASSRLVSKVGGGHNCWLPSNSACTDAMTSWIENWVGSAASGGRTITLNPPPYVQPGGSKIFPASSGAFGATIYPLLRNNCANCHVPNPPQAGQLPIAPFFAQSDVDSAYEAAQPKIDLNDETAVTLAQANSRLVAKLRDHVAEGHSNMCWDPNTTGSPSCDDSATAMLNAIQAFAGGLAPATPVTAANASGAVTLTDATVASGGNRYEANAIALYEFDEGSGSTAHDSSSDLGTLDPIDLTLSGNYQWVSGNGIEFLDDQANARDSAITPSNQLKQSIMSSGEYSVEAWVIPANVTQEDRNIVSLSGGNSLRNFTLGQTMYNYDFLHQSSSTSLNGEPAASTPDADEVLQSALQHVVATFDPINGRMIYVNGAVTNAVDPAAPGNLNDWSSISSALILGNEFGDSRPWRGILRLVAIHDRALTHQQIVQNFEVGVGEKYFMLFPIGHISGVPADSYIMFEFSVIDAYGYLFYKPTYVYLGADPNFVPGFTVSGIRIGVNGKLPADGQAFGNVNVMLGNNYDQESDQEVLSTIGTIIASENGVDMDQFFLMFDVIGAESNPYVEPPVSAPTLVDPAPVPDIGIHTFAEINASISAMTGVPTTNSAVADVYNIYVQQLPSVENIDGFLGSHQMAIAQLALTSCSELVDNNGTIPRATYFAGFDFTQPQDIAFNSQAKRDQVLTPLLTAAMNIDGVSGNLTSQPDETVIRDMLGATGVNSQALDGYGTYTSLIEKMSNPCSGATCGTPARTEEIVKATCAAAVGGAVMLIQ